jgi:hypothetical protein
MPPSPEPVLPETEERRCPTCQSYQIAAFDRVTALCGIDQGDLPGQLAASRKEY